MKKRIKTEFGNYIVSLIKQADMSQEEFYTAVGITKPYFYDLLTSSPPPISTQNRMISVLDQKLGIDEERTAKIYDLAAIGRNEIPADIARLIADNPQKIKEVRSGLAAILVTKH